jgi:uncharacterized protein DUF6655
MARASGILGLFLLTTVVGCGVPRATDTERSGVERLILSEATDRAVLALDTSALADRRAYLRASGFRTDDEAYALASVRDHLGQNGVLIADAPDRAEVIIEIRCGVLNTDTSTALVGIPSIPIPVPGVGVISTPELFLYKKLKQVAMARIALHAFDAETGKQILSTGPKHGQATFTRWSVLMILSVHTSDVPEAGATGY